MSSHLRAASPPPAASTSLSLLDATIDRVRGDLHGTAAARERDRASLQDAVRELADGGFGIVRVPREQGGIGGTLEDLFSRLTDLAAVDSNLAHVFRGHIGFVESLHVNDADPPGGYADRWGRRLVEERLVFGNAQSERNATASLRTSLSRHGDELALDGVKYYTTGSIYADWIQLSALPPDGDGTASVLVDARQSGVESVDDWDGFGQILTGSGTTRFTAARVDPRDVREEADEGASAYVAAVFQLVLLAILAGIAESALADTIAFVRQKRRIFGFAGETLARDDDLVQLVIGRLSANAHAARSLVLTEARSLDSARRTAAGTADEADRERILRDALLGVFRLQQVVPQLVLEATTELFEVGGASAVGSGFALDRHWRNARTVFSHNPALQRQRTVGEYEVNGTFTPWRRPQPQGDGPARAASGDTEATS